MSPPSLLISIVSYRSPDQLVSLAQHLSREVPSSGTLEVHATLNHGDDRAVVASLESCERIALSLSDPGTNVGFGAGHDLAYRQLSPGQWLVCLNPDLRLPTGWLRALTVALEGLAGSDVYLAGIPVIGPEGCRAEPFLRPEGVEALRYVASVFGLPIRRWRQGSHVYGVNGAAFCIRQGLLKEPFDREVFLFFEEYILAEKLSQAGGSAALLAIPPAKHYVGASRRSLGMHLRPHFLAAQRRYLTDYLSWPRPIVALLTAVTAARLAFKGDV